MFNYLNGSLPLDSTLGQVVVVPDYVERALSIGNLNRADLLNYTKSRQVINQVDYATWAAISENCNIVFEGRQFPLSVSLFYFCDNLEMSTAIKTIAQEDGIKQVANEYLNFSDTLTSTDGLSETPLSDNNNEEDYYHFKSIGETVLLIVRPGFLTHLRKSGNLLQYLRNWNKELEKSVSPECIASHDLYRVYLRCLKLEITTA